MVRICYRALVGVLAAQAAVIGQAAEPSAAAMFDIPPGMALTMEMIDSLDSNMKSLIWSAPRIAGNPGADHRGRTLAQDLADYAQSDAYIEELAKLRATLPASIPAGSTEIPAEAAEPVRKLLTSETCRLGTVLDYWRGRITSAYHAALVEKLLSDLPAAEQQANATRLQGLQSRIDARGTSMSEDVAGCIRQPVPNEPALASLLNDYNTMRGDIADRLYELKINQPSPDSWVDRPGTCPPPATSTTGGPKAKVIAKPDMASHYNAEAKLYSLAGRLVVRIDVAPTGCVVRAAVEKTSGAALLDQDAVAMAFGYQFMPAEEGGKPVGQKFLLPVSFSFVDVPP